MQKEYDLIVIGTGVAASTVASTCRSEGWSVAVIDSRPFGGTCPLRGCDPKKVLLNAAGLVDRHGRARSQGVVKGPADCDWSNLIRFKREFTEPVPKSREAGFSESGIDTFHGRARFTDKTTVEVGDDRLVGRKILIASGAKPRPLPIGGAEKVATSADFLEGESLPNRIVFIGGGYISFELAHAARRFGADVMILHRSAHPLKHFEPDVVASLLEATRDAGIDVRLETEVEGVEGEDGGPVEVRATSGGREERFSADLAVHGAGRVPEIDDLEPTRGGVERDKGILVNEYLQSVSNPDVYAAGDAAQSGGPALTPVASYEGQVAAENLLKPQTRASDYGEIPSVVFSIPPMASVGLRQTDAENRGIRYRVSAGDSSTWFTSRHQGNRHAAFKVLIEAGTGRILGAHLLGPEAENVINTFAVAMRTGMPASDLKQMRFTYPTASSDIAAML